MSKQAASTKVERKPFKLDNVRLSYPNLFKPRAMTGDDGVEKNPEYSASFILDKVKHKAIIKAIEAEVKAIAIATWGKVPLKFKSPLRDGASFVDTKTDEVKDGYGDEVVAINARSRNKQHTVRRDRSPAESEDELYGGCYVNAVITLYPWKHKTGGCGVSANLGPVQFFRNGDRFGTPVLDPDDHFEDLGDDDDGDDEPPPKKAPASGKKGKTAPEEDEDYDPTADL